MIRIRKWYAEGKQAEQIEEKLLKSGIPLTVTVTDNEQDVTVNTAEILQQQQKALQEVQNNITEMNQKYDELMRAFKLQQEYIDKKLETRDQMLLEALKKNMEVRKEIASSKENKKKWYQFWK